MPGHGRRCCRIERTGIEWTDIDCAGAVGLFTCTPLAPRTRPSPSHATGPTHRYRASVFARTSVLHSHYICHGIRTGIGLAIATVFATVFAHAMPCHAVPLARPSHTPSHTHGTAPPIGIRASVFAHSHGIAPVALHLPCIRHATPHVMLCCATRTPLARHRPCTELCWTALYTTLSKPPALISVWPVGQAGANGAIDGGNGAIGGGNIGSNGGVPVHLQTSHSLELHLASVLHRIASVLHGTGIALHQSCI
eukprot:2799100-Prymnesium_polylepis.2